MKREFYFVKPFVSKRKPDAVAIVRGSVAYPDIYGAVYFYDVGAGVIVLTEIIGLPNPEEACQSPIFGFHIHGGAACSGTPEEPFAGANGHYNPDNCPHPYHAGDLPPLFGVNGRAFGAVLTNRFTVADIRGKTIVLHGSPDDFATQPAGNSGERIACGEIK